MKIPIENVYYLLCYAWDRMEEGAILDVSVAGRQQLPELFAQVLANGMGHLLRRGLDRGYVGRTDDVAGLRGKLDVSVTLKRGLLSRARTHCHFDELSYDVLHNRIIKSTIRNLSRVADLDSALRDQLARHYRKLDQVSDIKLTRQAFRSVQLNRNNGFYYFLLAICWLIFENLIIDEQEGSTKFRDFREDRATMWAIFQGFVFNFYRKEQSTYRVSAPQIPWHEAFGGETSLGFLPIMQSDIVLEDRDRTVVIDTKFYKQAFASRYGRPRIRSDNLYQLFSYITNHSRCNPDKAVSGMLLYPTVDREFDVKLELSGYPTRVRSLDLNQPWQEVREELLEIVGDYY